MYPNRYNNLRSAFPEWGIEAFIVNSPENMYYLSGFDGGEGLLVVTESENYIVTDSRFWQQVEEQAPDWKLIKENGQLLPRLPELLPGTGKVGFESNRITYGNYELMSKHLGERLLPVSKAVEKLRQVKDASEVAAIRRAVAAGDQSLIRVYQGFKPGMTEWDVAILIENGLKQAGCSKPSFDTIALAGPRAALPHGRPGHNPVAGEMLLLDFGGFYDFYAGDMTRTLALERVSPRLKDIYNNVLEAQLRAIDRVGPGVPCREVDLAARDYLNQQGLSDYFGHSTGHGVGLEIHEGPTVSFRSEEVLEPGMVITIEPGVYIPGWGGIRIEDVVLVTAEGHEVLTASSKELVTI